MAKHTILVTGGAGFIGSHVVDAYIAKGHSVIVVDDLSSGNPDFLNPAAVFYNLDVRSRQLDEIFDAHAIDVVNHHAAQIDVRKSVEDPMYDAEINIRGGINLLELSVKYKVKKFILSSTGGAIYGSPEHLPAEEGCLPKPECPYGASKFCVEQYVMLFSRMYKLGYTIFRYPNVYGPRQNPDGEAGVCSILAGKMLAGETPTLYGHGKAFRDYVYVSDIAAANLLALERGNHQTMNLGSGKPVSVKELYDIIAELTGFSGKPVLKPLRPGEIQGIYISGSLAATELGWKPKVELKEGLMWTVSFISEMAALASGKDAVQ
ncbi:MAG: UDP-glucose 4-epimerase [Candidatus Hydrogenedentes bacterium ADurb.Bin101]|jgi:UDP-glucose 4-epimerase|nr:MAG: UDP-glucose 4-epimerase [Candidatus Hydrogenedentes bacterium ADurb.Bin101]HOC67205.1 NAD-dependent epimerase/dehydratase family protein [Candidatus Hydrogenedentota bacterium]